MILAAIDFTQFLMTVVGSAASAIGAAWLMGWRSRGMIDGIKTAIERVADKTERISDKTTSIERWQDEHEELDRHRFDAANRNLEEIAKETRAQTPVIVGISKDIEWMKRTAESNK